MIYESTRQELELAYTFGLAVMLLRLGEIEEAQIQIARINTFAINGNHKDMLKYVNYRLSQERGKLGNKDDNAYSSELATIGQLPSGGKIPALTWLLEKLRPGLSKYQALLEQVIFGVISLTLTQAFGLDNVWATFWIWLVFFGGLHFIGIGEYKILDKRPALAIAFLNFLALGVIPTLPLLLAPVVAIVAFCLVTIMHHIWNLSEIKEGNLQMRLRNILYVIKTILKSSITLSVALITGTFPSLGGLSAAVRGGVNTYVPGQKLVLGLPIGLHLAKEDEGLIVSWRTRDGSHLILDPEARRHLAEMIIERFGLVKPDGKIGPLTEIENPRLRPLLMLVDILGNADSQVDLGELEGLFQEQSGVLDELLGILEELEEERNQSDVFMSAIYAALHCERKLRNRKDKYKLLMLMAENEAERSASASNPKAKAEGYMFALELYSACLRIAFRNEKRFKATLDAMADMLRKHPEAPLEEWAGGRMLIMRSAGLPEENILNVLRDMVQLSQRAGRPLDRQWCYSQIESTMCVAKKLAASGRYEKALDIYFEAYLATRDVLSGDMEHFEMSLQQMAQALGRYPNMNLEGWVRSRITHYRLSVQAYADSAILMHLEYFYALSERLDMPIDWEWFYLEMLNLRGIPNKPSTSQGMLGEGQPENEDSLAQKIAQRVIKHQDWSGFDLLFKFLKEAKAPTKAITNTFGLAWAYIYSQQCHQMFNEWERLAREAGLVPSEECEFDILT
ncbi:MAG: hypothetical protein FJZ16_09360, partial [Candidatus Omnitrophica bacterium]|nr:hypothetical protein [Candidatus Omnitrophota bacterium]